MSTHENPDVSWAPPAPRRTLSPWLLRLPILAASGAAMFFFIMAGVVGFYQLQYEGLIYPGVSSQGMDLGGVAPQDAFSNLSITFTYPETAVFTFRDGDRYWQVSAADLGVSLDAAYTADAAYLVGRTGNLFIDLQQQLDAWLNGAPVPPRVVYDETRAAVMLRDIARQIDKTMQNAAVHIDRDSMRAAAAGSVVGRELLIRPTLDLIRAEVLNLNGAEIPLVVEETSPHIWDTTAVAEDINKLLAAPLKLYIKNPKPGDPEQPWIVSTQAMLDMLVIDEVPDADGAHLEARLNPEAIRLYLENLAPALAVETADARFVFDDAAGTLTPILDSVNGRQLNVDATLAAISQASFAGLHEVPLIFTEIIPTVHSGASAADLGITERVAQATTYFSGSSAVRMTNIEVAASRFHGLVVAPGQEFSFNQYLGDVSAETGFEEGLIIYNGRTVTGVGGGVCQVSTTAFQAAFYAGYPVTERYPHGYRVSYYETGEGAGMDATVFEPLVDLKFINDTPYYLLIETYFNAAKATLTFKFYSTGMNREIVKEGPFTSNVTPHGPPVYEVNAALRSGQRRQVDYAVNGADVTVRRLVYQDGRLLRTDIFTSHYLPWQAVIQVAPGEVPGQ
ncbi:MAG: VanW family protein [Anaerolineae bacterium]|nr:VanW family protein [Anaerolineae bacterium]